PLRLDGEETVTRKERRPDLDPASVREPMLAQPRMNTSRSPPGRDNGARAARTAAPGVRPPSTTFGDPPRTNCAISGAAAKLRRFGSGLGFVGSPVGHTTGDFLLALGLCCARRLERRFKLQPQRHRLDG